MSPTSPAISWHGSEEHLMRRAATWFVALAVGLFGIGDLLFAIPNFVYAGDCPGSPVSWRGCMEFYEGVFAVVAGLSLIAGAVLLVRGAFLRAAATAFVGTVVFNLFFWLAAVPTELSDPIFAYLTLPAPAVCLLALLTRLFQVVDRAIGSA